MIFWLILSEVVGKWEEVCIVFVIDLILLDETEDMIVAFELFLPSIDWGFHSLFILCVRFIIDSGVCHVRSGVFFFEGDLETDTVGLDEFEFVWSECLEKILESSGQIVTRVLVDGCRIEIDEEILESEFLHALDRFIWIDIIEVFVETHNETVLIVSRTIIVDEVGQECPDSIDSCRIPLFFRRIEDGLVEGCEKIARFISEMLNREIVESDFREICFTDFAENLFESLQGLFWTKITLEEFLESWILDFGHSFLKHRLLVLYIEGSKDGKVIGMWCKYPLFLIEESGFKFIETRPFEIIPSMRDGWCEEVGAYDAQEYKTPKEADDIFFRFPLFFVVFGDIWGSSEDSEEEWKIHRDTIPDNPICSDNKDEGIEASKYEIEEKEFGPFFLLLESERKINEWQETEKGYIDVPSREIFGREEVRYDGRKWTREEVGVFKSEHCYEPDNPIRILVGKEEKYDRDEHEIKRSDFRVFSGLVRLHREIEWELEIVIDPILISEVPTEILILRFPTRGHYFRIRFVFDFFELFRRIYFGIINNQTFTLSAKDTHNREIIYSKLRYIFDDPREGSDSDSSQEYERYEKCFLKGNSLVLIESKGKEYNSKSYRYTGYCEEEIGVIFWIIHIQLSPESCFGKYPDE